MTDQWKNKLFFGDNLDIMRDHIADESVDLIYLDPPFNSNATYNVLFQEKSGEDSPAQITAFEDSWHWDQHSQAVYEDLVKKGPEKLSDLVQALYQFLGANDMMAYLVMMAVRLVEIRRVLKINGSLYLHCDPTASHYIKLLLDAVFSARHFRNEIVWQRTSSHPDSKKWGHVHDILFFYTKSDKFTWNTQYGPYSEEYLDNFYRYEDPRRGRYRLDHIIRSASMGPRPNLSYEYEGYTPEWGWRVVREKLEALDEDDRLYWSSTGRPYLKRFLSEMPGVPLTSIWTDILPVQAHSQERLGYPTQKPEALLERIISASSNEGDIVMDPFCGCGTTVSVAEGMGRRWMGIDVTHVAIGLMETRLLDTYGNDLSPYTIVGVPQDVPSARKLAMQNRYQFEYWALYLVGAQATQDRKKGADRGIDGYVNFFDDESGQAKKIVIQVKSGSVGVSQIRDLKGVMEREDAVIGVFITLEPPTGPMGTEAVTAGFYEPEHFPGQRYPKLQILTIEELLNGKQVEYPRVAPDATFKKAKKRSKGGGPEQRSIFDGAE